MTIEGAVYEVLLDALNLLDHQGSEDIRKIGEFVDNRLSQKGFVLAGQGLMLNPEKHVATVELNVDGEKVVISTNHDEDEDELDVD